MKAVFYFVMVVAMSAATAFSQGTRGTIRGTVTDANQAVVANATVRLTDSQKGTEVRSVTTGQDGVYQFVEIEPSTYNIVVTAANFAELRISDVKVEPNRNLVLDATVSVGGVATEVEVTAGAELIDRESPTLGTTVERRRVEGLPLNGRNVLNLALLQPGVVGGAGGLGLRVNGSRSTENNVTIDGANNNEVAAGGVIGGISRPDAVQEFRLLTSNFEAEFGRNTGSIINVVTRSGTNGFHGNARFFYRPTELSAANFFENSVGGDPDVDRRSPFDRKEYGFNLGGPVYFLNFGEGVPVIYDGKNRTFFFIDFERRWQKLGASLIVNNLPNAAELGGNFSGLGTPIFDPLTATAANPGGNPFPGNIIPANRISPIARYYLDFFPAADAAGRAVVSNNTLSKVNYFTGRLDHNFNSNHLLNFTYNYTDSDTASGRAFQGTDIPGFGSTDLRSASNYVGRYTSVFGPNVVNTFLFSYAKNDFPSGAPVNTTTPAQIGFTADFVANGNFAGPPHIFFYDRGFSIGNGFQGPQARVSENFQFQDAVSYVIGNHRLKFGGDFGKYKQGQDFLFINQGAIGYGDVLNAQGSNTVGDDFADFLLGNTPNDIQFGSAGRRDFRQHAWAGFIQDNWRATSNLSLSFGVRYEYNSPLTDKEDRVAFYRPGVTSQRLQNGSLSFEDRNIVSAGNPPNGLVYVGDPDPVLGGTVPRGGIGLDKNNFAPRFGFAYSLNGGPSFLSRFIGENQTVIRGGIGQYYGAIIGDTALQQLTATGYEGTNAYFPLAGGTLANPFGADPFPFYRYLGADDPIIPAENPFTSTADIVIPDRLSQFAQPIDPLIKTPVVTQFNLTMERSFARNYVLGLSYVGNRGRKLYVQEQINPALGTLLSTTRRFEGPAVPAPTTGNAASRRVNNDIPLGLAQLTTKGRSQYDSFQANLQKRFGEDGLSFQLAYTFSKSLNDASDSQRGNVDIIDQDIGWARSADDYPHRFVGSFIYDLPFFRNTNGFVKRLVDGWSIGGIYTYQSGNLFTVNNSSDTVGTGGGVLTFADVNQEFVLADTRAGTGVDRFRAFNNNAFRNAVCGATFSACINADGTRGRRGTSSRNQFRLDNPTNNWDAILSKKTRLWGDSANLELRFEAFNLLNTVQFTTVNTTLGGGVNPAASFGTYTAAAQARSIQLGARINF